MSDTATRKVEAAELHLSKVAYRTLDNPYLRAVATTALPEDARSVLVGILDGDLETQAGLDAIGGLGSGHIGQGILPRELQLLVRDDESVGVESVSAFVEASRFWWVASYLWCMEAGRLLDNNLGAEMFAHRLHSGFKRSPRSSGWLFRNSPPIRREWTRVANEVSRANAGIVVAATQIDLRGFFYSVDAAPSEIVRTFARSSVNSVRLSKRAKALTQLLDAAHEQYAEADARIRPRGHELTQGRRPLPVGFPSSQVLANLIVGVAFSDLASLAGVEALSAYVDDILLVSTVLPEVTEPPLDYLLRLGVVQRTEDESRLASQSGLRLASLVVAPEKCGISYSRSPIAESAASESVSSPQVVEDATDELGGMTPYFDLGPGLEWGGRLRTVLRAPFKRERIPKELVRDIRRLVDEIRIGLDADSAAPTLADLVGSLHPASILELREHWTHLIACAYFAGGVDGTTWILREIDHAIELVEPPPEANQDLRDAIASGLRFSLKVAVTEALAVARGVRDEQHAIDPSFLEQVTAGSTSDIEGGVERVIDTCFVSSQFVSVPLSEFTDWNGPLFGPNADDAFIGWINEDRTRGNHDGVAERIARACRFVPLHEICLATHTWVQYSGSWRSKALQMFSRQPLMDRAGVTDLRKRVRMALEGGAGACSVQLSSYNVRFAIPSVGVSGDQLAAIVSNDRSVQNSVARAARTAIVRLTREASSRRADVLVLPEWSIPRRQLAHVFSVSARKQMLVVGGEAPLVRSGRYSNLIWTGIPLVDATGRRSCLVPPPREKRYLSNAEMALTKNRLSHIPDTKAIPIYRWKGLTFASLICFEFADIQARERLRAHADMVLVCSWNMDWRYFAAIQEATTRDNYCLTVCVNTSQFPGTRITRPVKSEKMVALSVHGSTNPTVVTRTMDLLPIVVARASGRRPDPDHGFLDPTDDLELGDYKALPPTFSS